MFERLKRLFPCLRHTGAPDRDDALAVIRRAALLYASLAAIDHDSLVSAHLACRDVPAEFGLCPPDETPMGRRLEILQAHLTFIRASALLFGKVVATLDAHSRGQPR